MDLQRMMLLYINNEERDYKSPLGFFLKGLYYA